MTSLSPGTGIQRQGRQARSSSVNLKQQHVMLNPRTSTSKRVVLLMCTVRLYINRSNLSTNPWTLQH